jgi:solute:Na+ symporter, SSS family
MTTLAPLDLLVLMTYMVVIVFIGVRAGRNAGATSEGYFLANKSLMWPMIGASFFASNISTVHLVGLSESGFRDGIVWGNFEWFSVLELIILAFVFIPFYIHTRITTLPEFLEKRYDKRSRMLLAIFSIFAALFMHIGVSLYAGAVVFQKMFGVDILVSILIIAVATGVYTVIGGFVSVVVTETVQTVLLLAGSFTLLWLAIYKLPEVGVHSYADLQAVVGADKLKAVSFDSSARGFTFMDMLFGHLVLGLWYWCTDQTIVQRALGARSARQAQLGALFAGFLKLLPVFLMVIPGILAYALFREQVGAETKSVLPVLIMNLMPVGIRGLMLAAILAAVMSSVAAALNSCSTLVVFDVFEKFKPGLPDKTKVMIGKITTALVLVLAVSWSPFLADLGSIFELINQMFSIFAPAIVAVFLWGVISHRGTATASFWTLTGGSLAGLCVFIVEKYIPIGGVAHYISSSHGLGIHWLTQTYLFFIFSSVIYFAVTWLDRRSAEPTRFDFKLGLPPVTVVVVSFILIITLVTVYLFFY